VTAVPSERQIHQQMAGLIAVLSSGVLYLFYAYDVFVDETRDTIEELRIELDEALLYGVMLTLLLCAYAVRLYVSRRRQRAAQAARIAEARRTGEIDALTGLPNRRRFDTALATMLGARRDERCDAVLMIDLDRFKPVNDRHGHAAGDALLRVVGERLSAAVRAEDLVARIGGDEFAVVAPAVGDRATAEGIAARVLAVLEMPIEVDGVAHRIGASIGIAMTSAPVVDGPTLVAAADRALYRVKRGEAAGMCVQVLAA
jgi:diguanylate cyclase (GGDEF)-like protein